MLGHTLVSQTITLVPLDRIQLRDTVAEPYRRHLGCRESSRSLQAVTGSRRRRGGIEAVDGTPDVAVGRTNPSSRSLAERTHVLVIWFQSLAAR